MEFVNWHRFWYISLDLINRSSSHAINTEQYPEAILATSLYQSYLFDNSLMINALLENRLSRISSVVRLPYNPV